MKIRTHYILLLLLLLFSTSYVDAQKKDYKIRITIANAPTDKFYLVGYNGVEELVMDSALISKKGTAIFQGTALASGFYRLTDTANRQYMELLVDQDRFFSIETSMKELPIKRRIKNSPENVTYFEFQKTLLSTILVPEQKEALMANFSEMSPKSLLSAFLRAVSEDPQVKAHSQDTFFLAQHYYDHIDLNDERLLHAPFVAKKILDYFKHVVPQNADSLNKYVDIFFAGIENPSVREYYLGQLLELFDDHYQPEYEAVLVHVYDAYYVREEHSFLESNRARILKNRVKLLRKLLPGTKLPYLESYDKDGHVLSTKEVNAKYTLLWFWDPDCDDCVLLTPQLHEIYLQYHETYDFEVYALALVENYQQWQDFVNAKQLSWLNTSLAGGEPNYDVIEYFNIFTTPFILLLDANHKIVRKQFPVWDLLNIINEENNK